MRKEFTALSRLFYPTLLLTFIFGFQNVSQGDVIYATPLNGAEMQIGNILEWSTEIENNSQMFIVEKSFDGVDYENIGVVDAAGESEREKGYRFLDINTSEDKAFYRLRQMDFDGTGSFSQTVMVKRTMANNFMVVAMSNTTTKKDFEISLDALKEGKLEYEVSTLEGEPIIHKEIDLDWGLNVIVINLENEKEGAYKIRLQSEQEQEWLLIRKGDLDQQIKDNVASQKSVNGG